MFKRYYRHVRTQNERRQTGTRKDRNKAESGYQWARGKRRHLPTLYDEFVVRHQKSWKKSRKAQYYQGGRGKKHIVVIPEVGEFALERYFEEQKIPFKVRRLWYTYERWSHLWQKMAIWRTYKEVEFTYWTDKEIRLDMVALWPT